jgi:hypothetical protein
MIPDSKVTSIEKDVTTDESKNRFNKKQKTTLISLSNKENEVLRNTFHTEVSNLNIYRDFLGIGSSSPCVRVFRDIGPERNKIRVISYLENLEYALIGHIREADVCVGCMSWLTNVNILQALKKKLVLFVVQKEDFLRSSSKEYYENIVLQYSKLHALPFELLPVKYNVSLNSLYDNEMAVRCFGRRVDHKSFDNPRMHHKFIIFMRWEFNQENSLSQIHPLVAASIPKYPNASGYVFSSVDSGMISQILEKTRKRDADIDCEWPILYTSDKGPTRKDYCEYGEFYNKNRRLKPYGVWTGSFNLSKNSVNCLENATYIEDAEIAAFYMDEFVRIFSLSESIEWKYPWIHPDMIDFFL